LSGSKQQMSAWCVGRSFVVGEEAHQLGRERPTRREERRHGGEHGVPIGNRGSDPRGHERSTIAQLSHGDGERLDESVKIEGSLDVTTRQHEHSGPPFTVSSAHEHGTHNSVLARGRSASHRMTTPDQSANDGQAPAESASFGLHGLTSTISSNGRGT
jgi:hypothetical protein